MAKTPISAIGTSNERGLTLLELLVVIVLIGLLATVGAQAIPGDERRLQRATDHVEHQLRMARLRALKTGSSVNIPCNELTAPRQAASAGLNEDSAVPGSCIGSRGPAVGVTFFADGSSSGEVIELAVGKGRVRIHINPLTGTSTLD